jgi:hypothetical protein
MIKEILVAATLALSLAAFAADTTSGGTATAPAAAAQPKNGNTDAKSQRSMERTLRANCITRADADKLKGEGRKKFIAKCVQGS